jgi:hypothetical protein
MTAVLCLCAGLVQQAAATAHAIQRPKDMTQAERLHVMNRLGAKAASGTQWHYRLQPQCMLEVVSRHHAAPPQNSRLALRGTHVDLGHDAHDHRYKVRLSLAQAPQAAATLVFDSPLHMDAMLMKLLLVHLRKTCEEPQRRAAGLSLQAIPMSAAMDVWTRPGTRAMDLRPGGSTPGIERMAMGEGNGGLRARS